MKEKFLKALQDKDFSELLKGSSISFLLRFGGLAVGYILTLVIANLFGAKGLGDYVLAIIVLRLFTLFAKLGLDTASIRFLAAFASQNKWTSIVYLKKQFVLILSVTSVIASLLMYFLAEPIAGLIGTQYAYIQLNAFFILPLVFFMLHYQSLRGLKRIAEFSFFYGISQTLFTIIVIFIIYQFYTFSDVPVYAYVVSIIIVSVMSYFSYKYWLRKKSSGIKSAEFEVMSYKKLLQISIPLMFAQSVQFIMIWTDKLMLGAMTTSEQVGIYHTAFKLSMFAAVALMSINSIASPKFAEMYSKNDMEGLKRVVHQSTKMILWTSIPLVIIFFMYPKFFLGMFGKEFEVGVMAFIFLSFGRLISSFSGSVGNILQMTGNQVVYMNILFIGAILNILLNFLLIPASSPLSKFGIFGINGAAIASMSSLIFWNLSMVLVVKKKFGFYTFYIPFIKR
ncbi:MAG: flippase [Flavobacteriales bacterium]|nr:flippase [Flavobacteriales bacterium]